MRAGGDHRGGAPRRRARRIWLLANFDKDLGPDKCRCWLDLSPNCTATLDIHSLTVDRINQGGSYARDNIQPACRPCQNRQGALITAERRQQWLRDADEARARGIDPTAVVV